MPRTVSLVDNAKQSVNSRMSISRDISLEYKSLQVNRRCSLLLGASERTRTRASEIAKGRGLPRINTYDNCTPRSMYK